MFDKTVGPCGSEKHTSLKDFSFVHFTFVQIFTTLSTYIRMSLNKKTIVEKIIFKFNSVLCI